MEFEGKRLLILGGPAPVCKVVNEAKKMGIHTIVTDMAANAPAKKLADEALPYSVTDSTHIVEWCRQHPVDGAVNFCVGLAQETHLKLAEEFGFPCYGTKEQYNALTDKRAFKQLCVENNVDIIRGYSEDDIHSVVYPVLVKPTDSSGSRGGAVCYTREEFIPALKLAQQESTTGHAIIEQYMAGYQDLTISYLIKNGEPTLISVGDRYPGREEDGMIRQLACTIQPSRYTGMYVKYVDERVKNMLRKLGLKNSPVFMQGFVDGNTVRMYDPAIRWPGNDYELIYEHATGMSPMRSIITYAMGGEIDDYDGKMQGSYDLNGKTAMQYMVMAGEGTIATYDGLDEIRKLPFVLDAKQRHFIGNHIEQTGNINQRVCEISILVDRDPDKMREAVEQVQSLLKITDTDGKNMIISAFDKTLTENYRK